MEPSSPLREGDSVRLSCDAQSPVALDYQWKDAKVSMRLVLLCFRLRGAGLCGKLGRARSLLHPPARGQGWMGVTLLWACVACPYTFTPWLVLPGGPVRAAPLAVPRREG